MGGVACCADHASGRFRRLDHRDQQASCADVQVLFDQDGIGNRKADHRFGGAGSNGLQLRKDKWDIIGSMLRIDKEPIEPRSGADLGGIWDC